MELIITIDDKELPLIMRAYGISVEDTGPVLDAKEQEAELIRRIEGRLYSNILSQKQADVSNTVTKSTELTVAILAVEATSNSSKIKT